VVSEFQGLERAPEGWRRFSTGLVLNQRVAASSTTSPMPAWEALTMEYLVTMTTQVPDGTSEAAVQDIRTREAARSRELAAQGHLLRLWRPPLQPGEWRSLGLFAADDSAQLEEVLASMPLRVWRTDEVTRLSSHPNDPARQTEKPRSSAPEFGGSEFLTTFTVTVPARTPGETVDATNSREAQRVARELAGQEHLLRLWMLPGQGRALGLWQAHDTAAMQAILASLPLYAWMSVQTTPLTPHPSDPARTNS
jgi:muconolactone delta-isomerase